MYGIEPLRTWINSRSFYTKMYGIESYHILPLLWWVTFLMSPDVQVMCDEHLIHAIIFIVPVIFRYIHLPWPWYQEYSTFLVVIFCGSSTPTTVQLITSSLVLYHMDIGLKSYITMYRKKYVHPQKCCPPPPGPNIVLNSWRYLPPQDR